MKTKPALLLLGVATILGCAGAGGVVTGIVLKLAKDHVMGLLRTSVEEAVRLQIGRVFKTKSPRYGSLQAETFFFEPELALWVEIRDPDHYYFFEDEAKTKPAGHDAWDRSAAGVKPETITHDLIYLAGTRKDQWAKDVTTLQEDGGGSVAGEGADGNGTFEFTGAWEANGAGQWTQRVDLKDASWISQVKTVRTDGTYSIVATSSKDVTYTFDFLVDDSGTGKIEGNGEGLPATLAWDTAGSGQISWADGTKTAFVGWLDLGS